MSASKPAEEHCVEAGSGDPGHLMHWGEAPARETAWEATPRTRRLRARVVGWCTQQFRDVVWNGPERDRPDVCELRRIHLLLVHSVRGQPRGLEEALVMEFLQRESVPQRFPLLFRHLLALLEAKVRRPGHPHAGGPRHVAHPLGLDPLATPSKAGGSH
eukprot:CAMPEP_0117527836 /NCGR_PEP_ID=MMETSP0784-20121206/37005_1 /TAXON_ID=39447 /ORGANISM="" /LENGTH=158 /DNA_ID=CAMNT_0005324105 /DNA_START=11 /DNA_END=485 /DNA_ORIENTATION=-